MKNKRVKQMMVDIERHYRPETEGMWFAWIDGVCLCTSGANFLWVNKYTASIKAKDLSGEG